MVNQGRLILAIKAVSGIVSEWYREFPSGTEIRVVPRFEVRWFSNLFTDTENVRKFTVELPTGRRMGSILNEIIVVSFDSDIVGGVEPPQGRFPDGRSAARWWAQAKVDGSKLMQIARNEETDPYKVEDRLETIARTLRRLG